MRTLTSTPLRTGIEHKHIAVVERGANAWNRADADVLAALEVQQTGGVDLALHVLERGLHTALNVLHAVGEVRQEAAGAPERAEVR